MGGVSREDLDKAIGHDLAHAPVRGIMSSQVASAHEDASLAELRTLVTAAEDGRVAVLRDGRARRRREPRRPSSRARGRPGGTLRSRREHRRGASVESAPRAGSPTRSRSSASAQTASTSSAARSATSSSVRRASTSTSPSREMRSRSPTRSPRRWAGERRRTSGSARRSCRTETDERVDVVTTRTEFYDAPGALPTVERAGLREDLFRRDFTINAMAASLGTDDFGRLVDPYGGRRGSRRTRAARPPQPLVHRRPDADLPRHPLRGAPRISLRGAHGAASPRLHRDGSRRRSLVVAAPRRARRAARGARCRRRHPPTRRARRRPRDPSAPARRRRRGRALLARVRARETSSASTSRRWRIGLAALARELPPDEAYDWLDRLTCGDATPSGSSAP